MTQFPKWFWISILSFVLLSWVALPIVYFFTDNLDAVDQTIIFIGLVAYPVFFIVMMVVLFKKLRLDSDAKVWFFLFTIVPILVYFPFWSMLSQNPQQIYPYTKTFSGQVLEVEENVLTVDCSQAANKTNEDWGFSCPVQITDETVLQNEQERDITIGDIQKNEVVKVTLVSRTNLTEDTDAIVAKQINRQNK